MAAGSAIAARISRDSAKQAPNGDAPITLSDLAVPRIFWGIDNVLPSENAQQGVQIAYSAIRFGQYKSA